MRRDTGIESGHEGGHPSGGTSIPGGTQGTPTAIVRYHVRAARAARELERALHGDHMELMQTLDDAWSAQDWDTFDKRHKPDTVVRWPAQPPTHGVHNHRAEGVQMFKTFPDNRVENRPYKVFFASGDWTCSIARFHGTMTGPMVVGGRTIPPTGKRFEVDFCTVARWHEGQIVEENLFYDVVGMMTQLGLQG